MSYQSKQEGAATLIPLVAAGKTEVYQALRTLYWKKVCAVVCTVLDAGASDKLIEEVADYAFETMRKRASTYDPSRGDFCVSLRRPSSQEGPI